jgi:DNA (cytosine-5)-methyltransferase 1
MSEYIWNLADLKKVKPNGYKVFSCFSCGGGSSMGYKRAGFEVVGNCEIDPAMNELYKKNMHPRWSYEMGVQDFKLLEDLPAELYGIDVLDGSPPCSTFSMAGNREDDWGKEKKFREGQAKQVLSDLFFEFIDVAEKLKPKIVISENVKGIVLGNARSYMNSILKAFDAIGYDTQVFLLNAAAMGVPQRRERVFLVSRRKDLRLEPMKMPAFKERPVPYGEFANQDFRPLKGAQEVDRWKKRKDSDHSTGDVVKRTEKGKVSGFTAGYLKRNEVAPTVTAGDSLVRFDVCGRPSFRDITVMQTFPQDYDFGSASPAYVCGMSVPPLMMEKVAKQVQIQLLDRMT